MTAVQKKENDFAGTDVRNAWFRRQATRLASSPEKALFWMRAGKGQEGTGVFLTPMPGSTRSVDYLNTLRQSVLRGQETDPSTATIWITPCPAIHATDTIKHNSTDKGAVWERPAGRVP